MRKGWSGPHPFIAADDHGVWYLNGKGNEVRVSLHVVKPFVPENWSMFAKLRSPIFAESRKSEIDGLFQRDAIAIVDASERRGHRLYRGSWIESLNSDGRAKSRIVVCATNERLNQMTYSPTVQRISTRLGYTFASCRPDFSIKCRDVTQAFIQSDTLLRRPVYLELPHELKKCNQDKILLVKRPLYG